MFPELILQIPARRDELIELAIAHLELVNEVIIQPGGGFSWFARTDQPVLAARNEDHAIRRLCRRDQFCLNADRGVGVKALAGAQAEQCPAPGKDRSAAFNLFLRRNDPARWEEESDSSFHAWS